jgi:hypothetical protein
MPDFKLFRKEWLEEATFPLFASSDRSCKSQLIFAQNHFPMPDFKLFRKEWLEEAKIPMSPI